MAAFETAIDFRIPFPPSINSLYDGGKKTKQRFKSDRYEKWCCEARQFLLAFRVDNRSFTTIRMPIAVWYRHGVIDDKRIRDAENYSKAISDLLKDEAIIEDDSLIKRSVCDWADDVEDGFTEIVICPLSRMSVYVD